MAESVMGDVVNLNKRRKRAIRERLTATAEANRVRFGRSKAERDLIEQRLVREKRLLDQHRIDAEDAS
jgi:hypothetical protein